MEYLAKLEELNILRRNIAEKILHLISWSIVQFEEAAEADLEVEVNNKVKVNNEAEVNNEVQVNNDPGSVEDITNYVNDAILDIAVDETLGGEEDIKDIKFGKCRPGSYIHRS